jgi:molecular chaperone DnaK
MALQRLKEAAEKAKCELSESVQTEVNLPFITADQSGPKHLHMRITRAQLEELTRQLVERCRKPVEQALRDAKLKPEDIDEVVLVGGMTRMPAVQALVRGMFNKEPHKGVNPDEVVAAGAAIQGAILAGEVHDVVLLDVTPLTLGIETLGGIMTPLIQRNTTIPTQRKEVFTTAADNQTAVDIHVLQGERKMALDNRTLGRFQLTGIPAAPRGVPQIEVTFDIDANGILNVSAKDLATGKQQAIRIEVSSGLSKDEVEKMKKEAEEHAEDDRRSAELVEARNSADQLVYTTERTLREHGDKVSADQRRAIEEAVADLKKVKGGDDVGAIRSGVDRLTQAAHTLAEAMYEQASQARQAEAGRPSGPGPQAGPAAAGGGENVVDADYEVMDEDDTRGKKKDEDDTKGKKE